MAVQSSELSSYLTENVRVSGFAHFFHYDQMSVAFNSLNRKRVCLSHRHSERIESISHSFAFEQFSDDREFLHLLVALRHIEVLVPSEWEESHLLEALKTEHIHSKKPRIRLLVLHLTDKCNLKCRYCFIESGKKKTHVNKSMSVSTCLSAIEWFARIKDPGYHDEEYAVVFYGGEPLLNSDVFQAALMKIQEMQNAGIFPQKMQKVLITNGTLVNQSIADLCRVHSLSLSISIDGFKKHNDSNRVFANGEGSFDAIMSGINLLKKNNTPFGISCVVNESNVDDLVEITRWFTHEMNVKAFGMNHRSSIGGDFSFDEDFENKYMDKLIESHQIIRESGSFERRIHSKINAFANDRLVISDCTGCGEQAAVSPDGYIGICQGDMGERATFSGHVSDPLFTPEEDPLFIEWSRRSPLSIAECQFCECLTLCGGGCPNNARLISGNIWNVDKGFCIGMKKLLRWIIHDLHLRS